MTTRMSTNTNTTRQTMIRKPRKTDKGKEEAKTNTKTKTEKQ